MKANIKTIIEKIVSGDWGKEDVDNIGVKIIRTTNFTNAGNIDYDNIVTRIISEKNIQEKRLKKGDIIIEKSGGSPNQPVGRVVYFSDDDTEPILCNNFTSVIRCKNDVNSRYVFYYLYLNWCRGGTRKYQNKTTGILNLKLEKYLDDLNIELPSKEEQDNIVSILDKADEIRTKKRLANDKLDEFLKSTFISMFGDPVKNDKSLPIAKVGGLTTLVSSGSTPLGGSSVYQDEGVLFIRSQNVLMNKFDFTDIAHISDEIYNSMARTQVQMNDVLLNITGASIGRIHRYMFKDKANVNQHVCIIRPVLDMVSPVYLEYCIGNSNYQHNILRQNSGATRQAFNFEQIKGFKIPLPPIEEQNKFAQIVEKVEAQKQKNKEVIRQMDNLFNSLSQKAFKGEL